MTRSEHDPSADRNLPVGSLDPDGQGDRRTLKQYRKACETRAAKAGAELDDDAYIISPDVTGTRPRRPNGISLAVGRLKKHLGLESVTIRGLRHTVATQLLAAGVPVRTVAGRTQIHANDAGDIRTSGYRVDGFFQPLHPADPIGRRPP